ncbi:glycosyltransferase family A protein [Mucilaginibacter sp. CSA2-8R]|uniref:glycosyltransferase n=1 Tax=Mucilaginibacter sp. CSA2-8R TaxID=3141542 RepID=UPI00315C9303
MNIDLPQINVSLFRDVPLKPKVKVCVVVPVKNEAAGLMHTLNALRCQRDATGNTYPANIYEVLLLINNSNDGSYRVAKNYQQQYPEFQLLIEQVNLPKPCANVGTARRLLMDAAYHRLTISGNDAGIIASTDGDTVVDGQWLHFNIAAIEAGNDAVGGRILTLSGYSDARQFHLRDVTYRCLLAKAEALIDPQEHDPMPRHFQFFGASMAVTCQMYKHVGRLPRVPHLEDMAFYEALLKHDARIRKSFDVKVYTSARLQGRVAVGFSEQLNKWVTDHQSGKLQMVDSAAVLLAKYFARKRLRTCWERKAIAAGPCSELLAVSQLIGSSAGWLYQQVGKANYFGALWAQVEPLIHRQALLQHQEHQPVAEAITALRQFILHFPPEPVFQTNQAGRYLPAGRLSA